jgi:hypothetical protein
LPLDTVRGWRIAKEKAAHKIDAIVALVMGAVAAIEAYAHPRRRFLPVGD